ncbi:SHOCT domain-containing protein [Intrasporangium sp. YIM S08009]|uniref:SHOCT domain-containing protein n=1 Tax=Intrasporangium zincisolvens TaxID=3080018 RepID=UPI002B05DF7F|nr:SHOCT domain-containing protein [Intrasporangium sp. YIM S08009]
MMWNTGMGAAPWMWLVMGGGTVAFWLAVLYVARLAFSDRSPRPSRPREAPDARSCAARGGTAAPLDVLQGRLARGEIDVDEYARSRKALVDSDPTLGEDRTAESRR